LQIRLKREPVKDFKLLTGSASRVMEQGSHKGGVLCQASSEPVQSYPPTPRLISILVAYFLRRRDPLGCLRRLGAEYGDIVHMRLAGRHDYLLSHPNHIKAVLSAPQAEMARSTPPVLKRLAGRGVLTSQGDHHRWRKRMVAPAFHKQRIFDWGTVITSQSARLLAGLSQLSAYMASKHGVIGLTKAAALETANDWIAAKTAAKQSTKYLDEVETFFTPSTVPKSTSAAQAGRKNACWLPSAAVKQHTIFLLSLIPKAAVAALTWKRPT
jgi:NAD(P)-dependent dehydrogenase (short-subunit alcohol dehydrogenase family)